MKVIKPWPYPTLFAHRGGGNLAPENTLAAMLAGYASGYRAVEFDAKLTRDGVVMLMHDETLERTTNGKGRFRDWDAKALTKLDAGRWMGEAFEGEEIPLFTDVLDFLHTQNMVADIEVKPCAGREAVTGRAVGEALKHFLQMHPSAAPRFFASSFSVEALRALRAALPLLPLSFLAEQYTADADATIAEFGCSIFASDHAALDQKLVAQMHRQGVAVMAYTINDVERAREVLSWGTDAIFTDALVEMEAFL
jgi:glycerophosphoryl diester phosphodiesterase